MSNLDGIIQFELCTERDIRDSNCTFCISRDPTYAKIFSNSPARRNYVYLCKVCYVILRNKINALEQVPEPSKPKKPCSDGTCSEYRNMNGGCDVCGSPCL